SATGAAAPPLAILWTFTFADTGQRPLLIARSALEQPMPGVPPQPSYAFDRKTLALRSIAGAAFGITISDDGKHIQGTMRSPSGPAPIDLTLPAAAFFGPLADLVAESLPLERGVVYRVPLWNPGAPAAETHLYEV